MKFAYQKPQTLLAVNRFLEEYGSRAKIIAGGTDILLAMEKGKCTPEILIDVANISEMSQIGFCSNESCRIGAAVTHNKVSTDNVIQKYYTALAEASSEVGSPQIRNVATIGGNICNASPSAETAPPLLVFGAQARIVGRGERLVNLMDFFTGPSRTGLEAGEVLAEFILPCYQGRYGSAYSRLSPRKALDIAIVNVAGFIKVSDDSRVSECRIALGAVGPTPIRAHEAEAALIGRTLDEKTLLEVGDLAALAAKPISDVRASAEYRRDMVSILTRRVLSTAFQRAIQ